MASVGRDRYGTKIQFVDREGTRRCLRLGKCSLSIARSIATHIEEMVNCQILGVPYPREVTDWLNRIADRFYDKLASFGLVQPKNYTNIDYWLETWLNRKKMIGSPPGSYAAWLSFAKDFKGLFGSLAITRFSEKEAEVYLDHLRKRGYRQATIAKKIGYAKAVFNEAIRSGLINKNPFAFIKLSKGNPTDRRFTVKVEVIQKVIEATPNPYWKLLLALSRFAGLRIPSEALSLTWENVLWAENKLVVPSPKTARQGKPYRVIPLFPLVRPYLEQVWEITPEGKVYVFPDEWLRRKKNGDWRSVNLRTQFLKLLKRAGVEPWPKLWHNMRASFESDLARDFPLSVVTQWLGNTITIAMKHYIDVTDKHFERAINWNPIEEEKEVERKSVEGV